MKVTTDRTLITTYSVEVIQRSFEDAILFAEKFGHRATIIEKRLVEDDAGMCKFIKCEVTTDGTKKKTLR
jgi:hypothetical protein